MKVQFLKNTATAVIKDPPKNTLIIFREGFGYGVPDIPGAEVVEFLEYKKRYTVFTPDLIVLVGINRIITPSNRCDMVNEYLQTMTPSTPKISIDTDPFIGEPWRLWYHYSIANCGKFNISYSYIIEGEWQYWFYRDQPDCRLSAKNIRLFISDTVSDILPWETRFEFFDIGSEEESWYAQAKETVFEKYDTPKLIINNLLKLANQRYNLKISYDSYRMRAKTGGLFPEPAIVKMPDIGIYRFVAEEAKRRMDIYNKVVTYESVH